MKRGIAVSVGIRLIVLGALVAVGCGSDARDNVGGGGTDGAGSPPDAEPLWGARMSGKVWGPGHVFPVSGALVAVYAEPPDALPNGAYCERCVSAPQGSRTLSRPDGSFTLQLTPGTTSYLVVQKGQFRRVTRYTAPSEIGDFAMDEALTTLPTRTNAGEGTTIPKIAVVYGDYDAVQDIFAKVGLGALDGSHGLALGSEAGIFDIYDNHGNSDTPAHGAPLSTLINSPERLAQYNLIIFACSNNSQFGFMTNAAVQNNLRNYVRAGGKLYVSDYAMPVVERIWPEFIWFTDPVHGGCNEGNMPPNCNHGPPFNSASRSLDGAASDWLLAVDPTVRGASPHAEFITMDNWNTIGSTAPGFAGNDPNTGQPVSIAPKIWVSGNWNYAAEDAPSTVDRTTHYPLSLSFPFGCGRVMYTTYHTVGNIRSRHPGLFTQELLLWHLILELTVCSSDVVE